MKINLKKSPQLAILIDPDKYDSCLYKPVIKAANQGDFDFLMVGGSLTFKSVADIVRDLKEKTDLPVVLFPGDLEQICYQADALLFLSLLSGRNPEYLIGKHVLTAKRLKDSGMQIIPTGYLLISSGGMSSVQYMTQTLPLPADKPQLSVATALAGELLGMQMIYLEAGSNANAAVPEEIISAVKADLDIPLMVGGGIRSPEQMIRTYNAGADIVVIGSAIEQNPERINEFVLAFAEIKKSKL